MNCDTGDEAFLEKAQKLLVRADTMLGVGLNDDAGRTAYLAGFHAAQAFIFERMGKVFKSHKGGQTSCPPYLLWERRPRRD